MTGSGGLFLWGPPGTGKTTVITRAVRAALASGDSVLIASHTHVAADNVLEGLIEPADGWSCGEIIRVVPASPELQHKLSDRVREYPYLTLEKATAQLTDCVARQARLDRRYKENRSHEARAGLERVVNAFELAGVDVGELRDARMASDALVEIGAIEPVVREFDRRLIDLRERSREHLASAEQDFVEDDVLRGAQARVGAALEAREAAARALRDAGALVRVCQEQRDVLAGELVAARESTDRGLARAVPFRAARRVRRVAELHLRLYPMPVRCSCATLDYQPFPSAPGEIRTPDLRFRRPTLYPAELRARGGDSSPVGACPHRRSVRRVQPAQARSGAGED